MKKQKHIIDQFHFHEAVDRTRAMQSIFEGEIENHPVIKKYLSKEASKTSKSIAKLYQKATSLHQWKKTQ